jgi:serine protease Do
MKYPSFKLLFLFALYVYASAANALNIGLPDFTSLVEEAAPAVVNISTTQKTTLAEHMAPGIEIPEIPDDAGPLGDLLKRFLGEGPELYDEFDTTSLGSGFIISDDGYLVTNYHVVKSADEIIVKLSDRREFKAKRVGVDSMSDIALLKIDADHLPTLKMGDSNKLKVGEWVLAIGSPFGFDHSATAGIVSAKGRSLPNENYVPFIQTDVAINPGNSGGPLFNLDGEVVGINSQIYSQTGGFMGLSFAIPINVALDIIQQLKETGHVSRGWLGVYIQEVTRELAESFGMKQPEGALVAQVMKDSPAEKGGLRVGDVILTYNGQSINKSSDLPPMVGRTPIGKKAKVEVMRAGKPITLRITIGKLPEESQEQQSMVPHQKDKTADLVLGMSVSKAPAELLETLGLDGGVLVEKVASGPARDAGVRKGDVIIMVQQKAVKDPSDLRQIIGNLPKGKSVAVLIQRKEGPVFLALKNPG